MNTDTGWPGGLFFFLPFVVISLMALGVFIFIVGVFFKLLRSRSRGSGDRRFGPDTPFATPGNWPTPPIIDDSLTNPANPLYHHHHPPSHSANEFPSSPGVDFGSSHHQSSSTDFSSPSTSFDSGSTGGGSVDSGSASGGCSNP